MPLYRFRLTLQESVYYATREMGILYETGAYLHNYALSYAFFNGREIQVPYFCASYRPTYAADLERLNAAGIYVTPARPERVDYLIATWKMGQVTYYRRTEQFEGRNYPTNYGRAKELAPESTLVGYVISERSPALPRWIRLGKWHGKALVEVESLAVRERDGPFVAAGPLNPLDIPAGRLGAHDIISMPPSSLVANARLDGPYLEIGETGRGLPLGLRYTVPAVTEAGAAARRPRRRRETE